MKLLLSNDDIQYIKNTSENVIDTDFLTSLLDDTRELVVHSFGAWSVQYNNIIWTSNTDPQKVSIEYKPLSINVFKKIAYLFPFVYLGDGIITKYCNEYNYFDFFPTVEFSDESKCYIKKGSLKNVNVIINIAPLDCNNNKTNKHKKRKQFKTYLMIDGQGFCKIGRSYNPSYREATLQSQKPDINLLATIDKDIELKLQNKYSEYRIRGEWFRLSKKQIIKIINNNSFKKHEDYYKNIQQLSA